MRITLPRLAASVDPSVKAWADALERTLASLPISISSTTNGPNVAGIYANPGELLLDLASSATTRAWIKRSASTSTTGWSALSWI